MNVQYIESAILKQATINCFPLPDLVLAEIKDYLFYDPRVSKQIQETRKYKSETLDKIKNAYTCEKHTQELIDQYYNDKYYYYDDVGRYRGDGDDTTLEDFLDKCEWVSGTFTFQIDVSRDSFGTFVLGSYFCIDCGNYTFTGIGNNNLHERCKCICVKKDDDGWDDGWDDAWDDDSV
jgi:hypothetical protein